VSRIVYRYVYMTAIVADAIQILRDKSPVGSAKDKHPGLYRDSHMIFIDGHVVKDASAWQPGQQINISNPVPYSRKIESGGFTISVPGHVYEDTAQILAGKYGNSVSVKFVFMPVRFGSVQDYAHSLAGQAAGSRRRGSPKALRDWLVRQPALEIVAW
jgi:hypothetical protein